MSLTRWRFLAFAILATMLLTSATTALAASPAPATDGNDHFDGRSVVSALPFSDAVDMRDKTTDLDDPAGCGAGHEWPTVWYEFTPSHDMTAMVSAPTLDAFFWRSIDVFTGDPDNRAEMDLITCGGGFGFGVALKGGTTYYIMLGAYSPDGDLGRVQLQIEEYRYADIDLTFESTATYDPKTGVMLLMADISCSALANVGLELQISQVRGGKTIEKFIPSHDSFWCDGTPQRLWLGISSPPDGRWGSGVATYSITLLSQDTEGSVPLKRYDPITVTVPVTVQPSSTTR